jgi:hypothetical protein
MHMNNLDIGVSIADTSYPTVSSRAGEVTLKFNSSMGKPICLEFSQVPAFRWQEGELPLVDGERWDGCCELFGTQLILSHPEGSTLNCGEVLRHLKFNFNAWGYFEILCSSFEIHA